MMLKSKYFVFLIPVCFLLTVAGLALGKGAKKPAPQYLLKKVLHVNENLKFHLQQPVFLGVAKEPIGEVIFVKKEPDYDFILVELFGSLNIKISGVNNVHPDFTEEVLRLLPTKREEKPYKYLALFLVAK